MSDSHHEDDQPPIAAQSLGGATIEDLLQQWSDKAPLNSLDTQETESAVAAAKLAISLRRVPSPIHGDSSSAISLIGQTLGQYRIKSVLGVGGMGTVFRAHHGLLERDVALKIIRPERSNEPRFVKRFREEVKVAGQVDHPNVVRASDAFQINGVYALAMELIDGATVAEFLDRKNTSNDGDGFEPKHPASPFFSLGPSVFPITTACEIARQICFGIQHVHELGLIHRDIKPSNVILTSDENRVLVAKVLDLGLARLQVPRMDQTDFTQTQSSDLVGSLACMSPEQAEALGDVDSRTDVYSIGVLIYRMITGHSPYDTASSSGTAGKLAAILRDPPIPIADLCPQVDGDLAALIHQALEKHPDDRVQTCAQFAVALRPWAQSTMYPPIMRIAERAIAPESVPMAKRPPTGQTSLAFASGLMVAGLLAASFGFWVKRGEVTSPDLVSPSANVSNEILSEPEFPLANLRVAANEQGDDLPPKSGPPAKGPLNSSVQQHHHPLAPMDGVIEVDFRGRPFDEPTLNVFYEAKAGDYIFRIRPDDRGFLESDSVALYFYFNGDHSRIDTKSGEMSYDNYDIVQCPDPAETSFRVVPGTQKISVWPTQTLNGTGARIENSHTVCVLYCYPDLTYANAVIGRNRIHAGDDVSITFDIVNRGQDDAGTSVATIALDPLGVRSRAIKARLDVPSLVAGQTHSVSASISTSRFTKPGRYRLTVRIDHGDEVVERDELYLGSWKADEGKPFLPNNDLDHIVPFNNDFQFDIEVVAAKVDGP